MKQTKFILKNSENCVSWHRIFVKTKPLYYGKYSRELRKKNSNFVTSVFRITKINIQSLKDCLLEGLTSWGKIQPKKNMFSY